MRRMRDVGSTAPFRRLWRSAYKVADKHRDLSTQDLGPSLTVTPKCQQETFADPGRGLAASGEWGQEGRLTRAFAETSTGRGCRS